MIQAHNPILTGFNPDPSICRVGDEHVPPAEASLIAMLDVVMGPLWVWLAFREAPSVATVIGGAIVLAAALWRLAPELRRRQEDLAPAAPLL